MNPASLALWALFFAQTKGDVDKLIDKKFGAEKELKADQIVADAYVVAVKEYGKDLVTSVDQKVDKLALIRRAMWELFRDKYDLSNEILLNKVKEIDLLDGNLDGKVNIIPKTCAKCGRPLSKRHARCIYCGAETVIDTSFDTL
jgi:hypothetical protein